MEEVVAGLDIGTSSIKVVLYGEKGVLYSDRFNYLKGDSVGREIDPVQLIKDISERKFAEKEQTRIDESIGFAGRFALSPKIGKNTI